MEALLERRAGRMSGDEFRAFQEASPDDQRWELIGGEAIMMTPPTLAHNIIASNLQRLLQDALDRQDQSMVAVQRPGFVVSDPEWKPEPDVAVIDADFDENQRDVDRAYLLAEIVSSSDRDADAETKRPVIDEKRDLYREHQPCMAVLIVSQERMEVELSLRSDDQGWSTAILKDSDELSIRAFGLRCLVSDLYVKTHLAPRPTKGHTL